MVHPALPRCSYRIQLGPGLGLAAAAELAGPLAGLGINHMYVSPVLQARPGSAHGYEREPHRALHDWHRELIALRRRMAELRDGRREEVDVSFDADAGWIVARRGRVTVTANVGSREATLPATGTPLLSSDPAIAAGGSAVRLPPDSVAVLDSN